MFLIYKAACLKINDFESLERIHQIGLQSERKKSGEKNSITFWTTTLRRAPRSLVCHKADWCLIDYDL